MNKRPILRKVHLQDPDQPEGNMTSLVSVLVTFDKIGSETIACADCQSDRCKHCEKVFDDLCSEGVLHA